MSSTAILHRIGPSLDEMPAAPWHSPARDMAAGEMFAATYAAEYAADSVVNAMGFITRAVNQGIGSAAERNQVERIADKLRQAHADAAAALARIEAKIAGGSP